LIFCSLNVENINKIFEIFLVFFIPLCYCQYEDFDHRLFGCLVDALLIIGVPDGPTAHFKLSKLVLRKDLKVRC